MDMIDSKCLMLSSVSDALEGMVFSEIRHHKVLWSSIGITSPVKGRLILFMNENLASKITNDIYESTEMPITANTVRDTVAELANTIAGLFMNSLLKEDESYQLEVPNNGNGKGVYFSTPPAIYYFKINDEIFSAAIEGKELLKLCSERETSGECPFSEENMNIEDLAIRECKCSCSQEDAPTEGVPVFTSDDPEGKGLWGDENETSADSEDTSDGWGDMPAEDDSWGKAPDDSDGGWGK